MLKALIGISLMKGFSVPRAVGKSKLATKNTLAILFMISEVVVFLTTLIYKIIAWTFSTLSKIVKYLFLKFCKSDTVSEIPSNNNVINFEDWKNQRKAG